MGNTFPKLHQVIGIAYNSGPNIIHGGIITSSNVHLIQCLPQGNRVVPPPHEQLNLIQKVHSELGHFGIKHTYNLLTPHYH
jgi:hypothetical protein